MSLIDDLKSLGVNTDEALQRFMGKSELYEKMLGKLTAAINDVPVMPAFDAEDYQKALESAHTLKGVTGNLSVTPLFEGYAKTVDLLRAGEPLKARQVYEEMLPVQKEILNCIEKYKN